MITDLLANKTSVLCNKDSMNSVMKKRLWIVWVFNEVTNSHWMWCHVRALVASFLLSIWGRNVHVRSKNQCPHAKLWFILQLKTRSDKRKILIIRKQLFYTWNKYILIYIIAYLSCAIRHTLNSYILIIKHTSLAYVQKHSAPPWRTSFSVYLSNAHLALCSLILENKHLDSYGSNKYKVDLQTKKIMKGTELQRIPSADGWKRRPLMQPFC